MDEQGNIDIEIQSVLLAASNHDIDKLRGLLRTTPATATVQDPETGFTPLHAAIAACELDSDKETSNSSDRKTREGADDQVEDLEAAAETVRFLLQNGAIWNDLDQNNETPGCLALRLGLSEIYSLIVDAGVRAELLLSRLDEYAILGDDEDLSDISGDDEIVHGSNVNSKLDHQDNAESHGVNIEDLDSKDNNPDPAPADFSAAFLSQPLTFTDSSLVDSSKNGVMMSWETSLMEAHASKLLPRPGLRVLNIGHGMGIIDGIFQKHSPRSHHIIEAHPSVLAKMKEQGWFNRPGVVVHSGRWKEDILPQLVKGSEEGNELVFDAIFFDTFAEDYKALKEFFSEWVVQLLDSDGRFGFFNGMGADRQISFDVYNKIVEINLFEAGLDVEWEEIEIPDLQKTGEWEGINRSYWNLKTYKAPTCKFLE